ncbi:hypothetical protein ACFYYH_19175 [Streptomyces sp. NPDC002018]|uniref:hypothetical protein n=1 Tax=Streptomyces sp. NPDC002018 TaxID=3364629 RepID=UPI0036887413
MTAFLSSIGGKLAERWAAAVLLPGLLFVVSVLCAALLGHAHALDLGLAQTRITEFTRGSTVSVGVRFATLLLGAATVVLLARATGRLVQAVWFGRWGGPLARALVRLRRRRAVEAAERAGVRPVPEYLPKRPTWIGEQFRLVDAGIAAQYHGLRLGLVWPRLWILLPESERAPVQSVNTEFQAAAVVTGWGLLHLVVGLWWFPAALVGACVVGTGWVRGREHTATLSALIEATVDTHLTLLLTALNQPLPGAGTMTPELAERVNDQLHKGR